MAETMLMPPYGGNRVIEFDYRMPPDAPWPDDHGLLRERIRRLSEGVGLVAMRRFAPMG